MADPDFVCVPTAGLVNADYLKQRATAISLTRSMGVPRAGTPSGCGKEVPAAQEEELEAGTSHVSIVDMDGNALSMTTTVESGFGSHQWVRGFVLNNQLTDFSFVPADAQGVAIANRVEPGKRPRSSMAPVLVFDNDNGGRLHAVVGSPGGSNIIQYVAKTLIGILDWNLDIQSAINLGNFGAQTSATTSLERASSVKDLGPGLQALGHTVAVIDINSGIQGITRLNSRPAYTGGLAAIVKPLGGWAGGADPRREGTAAGR
jgi:gamma-glutamyltranspeptidase/glutathione hydrolase